MKLNHKEFRIGNLVEYDGRVFEIDSVSEVLPTLNTIEFGIGVVDWNNLKPIQLNEDWLVKFGFKKIDKYTFVLNGFFIHNRKIGFVFNVGRKKIIQKFVHTIQNTYFCIEQKELKCLDTAQQNT